MNIIDAILIIIVFLAILSGYRTGFILGFFNLIGWLGSLLLTLLAYPWIVRFLDGQSTSYSVWTIPLIFFLTFIVIRLIVSSLTGMIVHGFSKEAHQNTFNRILGIIPGAFNGLIYAALLATLLLLVPLTQGISNEAQESQLAQRLTEPVSEVEQRLAPVFDDAIKRSMGRLSVAPKSDKFISLPYKTTSVKPRPDLEKKMLEMVNEERAKHGLKPLKEDPEMKVVARKHSADMFARGYFSHHTPEGKDPFDRMRAENVRFLTAGENLSLARTLNMAHDGLMNSPGHRANILRPSYGRVGIGVLDGGIYGLMITQNFRN